MNNFFQQLIQQFKEVWGRFSRTQKILLVSIPAALFVALMVFILVSSQSKYEVLYSRLEEKDAAEVTTELKKENIPYQVRGRDNLIMVMVPSDKVYDTRLALAGQGLPRGTGVGYEIFDQPKWGSTDFTQKVNYKRALEGELQRTISSLQEIETSHVSIVMPEP
ncbi:MAG TPA: flagellar basal-body MS-ring/collar protein FliF, partial [bacterium]|nr:flagellar basal-body MS-ring/collar protein FliF [bacterium]